MPKKGYKQTEEHRKALGVPRKGNGIYKHKPHTEKTKQKMKKTALKIGTGKWNKGKSHSEIVKSKISKALKGEKNGMWRGDKVGYNALHTWVRKRLLKPEFCQECNKKVLFDIVIKVENIKEN